MKILFFANYSIEGPSSRYRIFNYINMYREKGIVCSITNFWGRFYLKSIIPQKKIYLKFLLLSFYYPFCIIKRYAWIFATPFYDIIHIERDFCPGVFPVAEFIISKIFKKKVVYEFDDAVYLSCRPKGKTEKVIGYAKGIIAGNEALASFAKKFNDNVIVVPTVIDANQYWQCKKSINRVERIVTIGWIGTLSTIKYLEIVKNVLGKLASVYDIQLNVICNKDIFWDNGLKINNIKWSLNSYISELCKFDIGIMPLYGNEWENGKCGFKLIQYMGVGIPVIASPVGVNTEIVKDSFNGYLANNEDEWYDALDKLIKDSELRQKLGSNGKQIVDKSYSLNTNYHIIVNFYNMF